MSQVATAAKTQASGLNLRHARRKPASSTHLLQETYDSRNALCPTNPTPVDNPTNLNHRERSPQSHGGSGNAVVRRAQTHRHKGTREAKSSALVDLTNKQLAPEHTDYMVQALERKPDPQFQRTYQNGLPLEDIISSAPILTVGLKFLPGADKAQVNRTEEINMIGKEPDQKNAG